MEIIAKTDIGKNININLSSLNIDNSEYYKVNNLLSRAILYVITVISNPARFNTRYRLFNEFCERMYKEENVKLIN